jgi:hypothetical protein
MELEQEKLANTQAATMAELGIRVQSLKQTMADLQENISLYQQQTQARQTKILELASLQYETGELGFLSFKQIQENILLEKQQEARTDQSF